MAPRMLGGYVVLRELSQTVMGPVYQARPLWLNRIVVLNVMKLLWARNAPFVARFTREAYAAAQLSHNNLAEIHDFGEAKGTTYFCTEYVDGQSLAELVGQKKRLGGRGSGGIRPSGGTRAQVCPRPEPDSPRYQARKPAGEPAGTGQGRWPGSGQHTRARRGRRSDQRRQGPARAARPTGRAR